MKRVILVTGASSGIGKATAKKLISEGHTVYGAARHTDDMSDLVELGMRPLKMDITKEQDLQSSIDQLIKEQGKIDVLVNNAGIGVFGTIEDVSLEDARHQFDVNLFGLSRLTQLVIPHMRQNKEGQIINISSMGGKIYMPLGAWYHASKFALEAWSDCLRLELKQFNINVVIIEPGGVNTNFGNAMVKYLRKYSGNSAYDKMIKPFLHMLENTTPEQAKKMSSPPSVVAKLVNKIINSERPKTRYPVGKMAKPILFIRKCSSDRFFDWFISKRFG